jgi:plastocyanin
MRSNEWARRIVPVTAAVTVVVAGFAVWRGIETDTATAGPSSAPAVSDATPVEVRDFAFGPPIVTVAAGGTIEWTNTDQVAHSVRSEDGAFAEQTMDTGGRSMAPLDTPGSYAYICGIHPAMTGTIEVTP